MNVLNNIPKPIKNSLLPCVLTSLLAFTASCSATPKPPACASSNDGFDYTLCAFNNTKNNEAPNLPTQKISTKDKVSSAGIRLYWWDDDANKPFYTFKNLEAALNKQEQKLVFAMNAGMYDDKFAPLAYYVENGEQLKSLNQKQKGGGNFHLLPNGVYWIDNQGVSHVTETQDFSELEFKENIKFATQSGPMLVIDGRIHPKFNKDSQSLKIRNGVGVCDGKTVKFVISNEPVNFYDFAKLFKNKLDCDNALFLDGGRASALHASELNRSDPKYMGVLIGVSKQFSSR